MRASSIFEGASGRVLDAAAASSANSRRQAAYDTVVGHMDDMLHFYEREERWLVAHLRAGTVTQALMAEEERPGGPWPLY